MVKSMKLSTRTKNYDSKDGNPPSKDPPTPNPPNFPLTLEKPSIEPTFHFIKRHITLTLEQPNTIV